MRRYGHPGTTAFEVFEKDTPVPNTRAPTLLYAKMWEDEATMTYGDWFNATIDIGYPMIYPIINGGPKNYKKFTLADFDEELTEVLHKSDGTPVYKLVTNMQHFGLVNEAWTDVEIVDEQFEVTDFITQFGVAQEVNMLAFSSLIDVDAVDESYLTEVQDNTPLARLIETQISDITYENLVINNKTNTKPLTAYFMPGNAQYEEMPIQAIDTLYYGNTPISLSDITATFKAYTGLGTSPNPDIQSIMNGINFILEEYGDTPELLPRLNMLRRTFPETDTTTELGRIYEQVKITIYNANNAVKRGTKLVKKLVKSPVVTDFRTESFGAFAPQDEATDSMELDYLNPHLTRVSKFAEAGGDSRLDNFNLYIHGYFFFDYEKALRKRSNLSRLMSISKIESFFGQHMTNEKFQLHQTTVTRRRILDSNKVGDYAAYESDPSWRGREDDHNSDVHGVPSDFTTGTPAPGAWGDIRRTTVGTIITTYESDSQFPAVSTMSVVGEDLYQNQFGGGMDVYATVYSDSDSEGAIGGSASDAATYGVDAPGSQEWTYCCLRSFNFAAAEQPSIDGMPYRLMCFEFQDIAAAQSKVIDYDPTFDDYYTFQLQITDNTLDIYDYLRDGYSDSLGAMDDYKDAAGDSCSYNNIDGYFNEFFVNAMNEQYADNPQQAPWIQGPLLYHIHWDLMTNIHQGDKTAIIAAAVALSERIAPESGTLSKLEHFYDKMQTLWTNFYADTDTPDSAHAVYESLTEGRSNLLTFGALRPDSACNYHPLPPLSNIVSMGSDPTEEDLIEEARIEGLNDGKGPAKLIKMRFGFKNMPKDVDGSGNNEVPKDAPVFIEIRLGSGGSQYNAKGTKLKFSADGPGNVTGGVLAAFPETSTRVTYTDNGIKFKNDRWDNPTKISPTKERYRTVYLWPKTKYQVAWRARSGKVSVLISFWTPSNSKGDGGDISSTSTRAAMGQFSDTYAFEDRNWDTYYMLRCDGNSTISSDDRGNADIAAGRGIYTKKPTSMWENNIYEDDAGWHRGSDSPIPDEII